jgi:putative restriction endonuclease
VVFPTDDQWYSHFRPEDQLTVVDEVNFWRPRSQTQFRALEAGEPLFFRLKAPRRAIGGFGFFASHARTTIRMAWEIFGAKNGDPTIERFVQRIYGYRDPAAARLPEALDGQLSCLVLRDAVFLPSQQWLPWDEREGWADSLQSYKTYDLAAGPGEVLADLLQNVHPEPVPDLSGGFTLQAADSRTFAAQSAAVRFGQGAFRLRLLDAYGGRCAVTGEHALPVLEAAHIQPYLGPASNHVQNGLVLRADLHRLYDDGYVTVGPDLRLEVSRRLRDEFDNGEEYFRMEGRTLQVPRIASMQPSREALLWHAEKVFR